MSRKDKRLQRLFAIPKPKDFSWDELTSIMDSAGFKTSCQGGSHYTFENESGYKLKMPKSHPDGLLKQYQIDAVKEALKNVGEAPIGDSDE